MKRTLLFQILTMLMSLSAFSHDIEVKNADGVTIYYNWVNDKTELSVTYRGNYTSDRYDGRYPGKVVIPETVTYNGETYRVTNIGSDAFEDCVELTSIVIPNSVTSIDRLAFSRCVALTSAVIGNGVKSIGFYAFSDCTGLTSIEIPNSVTSIEAYAFTRCTGLTSIEFPNSVTNIGEGAFAGSLKKSTSIVIPNNVTNIGRYAFMGCSGIKSVVIGNGMTSIGERTFEGCTELTSISVDCDSIGKWFEGLTTLKEITLGEHVKIIGYNAFSGCTGLTSIEIPNSVTSLSGFSACTGLTSIEIPNSVTRIGSQAFSGCTGLTSIEIPNSVTSIGEGAFTNCTELTSIQLPNNVTHLSGFSGCTGLTSIEIPNSVTSIEAYAFFGCTGLTSIEIPNSVTKIDANAFSGCTGLTSIKIPNGVTSIGEGTFRNCTALTSIEIPNSVRSIGGGAFFGCTGLKSITIHSNRPPIADSDIASQDVYNNCVLYVPAGSENTYYASINWNKFYDIIAITDENNDPEIAYRPFIEEDKVWKVGHVMSENESKAQIVSYLYFDGDTIVNGHTAKRMLRDRVAAKEWESLNVEGEYVGAWYEKDKKVYCMNVENNDFELAYDFSLNVGETINLYDYMVLGNNGLMGVVTKRATGGMYGFKGNYLDIEASWEDKYWSEEDMKDITVVFKQTNQWLEGIGSEYPPLNPPFVSFKSPFATGEGDDVLMSCSIDDEVIYYNDDYEDGASSEAEEAKKRRFDFNHTIKTQPKSPQRRGEEVALYGEYNDRVLDVKLDRLNELYEVQITNNKTSEVTYSKTINAKNIVALNINISKYPEGQYEITIDNSKETFNGVFDTTTTGIAEIINSKSSNGKSIYNLQGQRINGLQRGLNIMDGKKVFVR